MTLMARYHYKDYGCSGPDLVPGAARGNRTFFLGPDGLLRGVTYRQAWTPGENVAQCLVATSAAENPAHRPMLMTADGYSLGGVWFGNGDAPPALQPGFRWDPCEGLDPKCACGFYAYHREGVAGYGFTGRGQRLTGVIEGYGKVVLGPQGFRAAKARIVALRIPTITAMQWEVHHRRLAYEKALAECDDLLDVPYGVCNGLVIGLTGAAAAALLVPFYPTSFIGGGICLVGGLLSQYYGRAAYRRDMESIRNIRNGLVNDLEQMVTDTLPETIELLKANYPGIPMYDDEDEMHADWPVPDLGYLLTEHEEEVERD